MKSAAKTALSTNGRNAVAKAKKSSTVTVLGPLTASALKNALWDTLQDIRSNDMPANRADAVASQAREILRTVKTQLQVANAAKRPIPMDIVEFSER